MKNMMRRSTFREIKGSFSRWLAILGIVALGVGFFAGLKVTKEAFTETGDQYLQRMNLFDFELISTLGIDDNNVDAIKNTDGVLYAEGSYSCDALINSEGSDVTKVSKMHTINDNINLLEVKAGRLPEKDDECVVDYAAFSEGAIGSKITISDSNDKDTREHFRYKEYTIVGLVSSPTYLNYERGSTALGNGAVNCFIYLTKGGWDSEFYTEMYVKVKDGEQTIFSKEYDDKIDSMKDAITDSFESTAYLRYDEILEEANEKLAEKEQELKDAKEELEDGKKEIADNEKKLKDGEKEISNNEKKLATAEKDIADGKKQLKDAEKELAANKETLQNSKAELEASEKEYNNGLKKFEEEKETAYAALEPLLQAMAQTEGTPYYDEYKAKYDTAKLQIENQLKEPESQLAAAKAQIDAGKAELAKGEKELEAGEKEIEKNRKALEKAERDFNNGKKELRNAKKEIADGKIKLEDAKAELADGEEKILDGEKAIKKAKKKVKDISEPDTYVLTRTSNIGYVCFDSDTSIVQQIARVFPIFFFLVAALVVMTTMTRMVDEQRTQIGVLKALGYSRRKIMSKYLFYTTSAAAIGGVAGFFIGSYLFPYVIWTAYGMMYNFSSLIPVINYKLGLTTILVAIVCAVSATLSSCLSEMKEVPAELIRPKAPSSGKRIIFERIGFLWKRLPFLQKVSLRNIFRYKKRFIMMLLGICGCTALLVTGMGISDSVKTVVSTQYEKILNVDYTVTFDDPVTKKDGDAFVSLNSDVASKALYLYSISMDADNGDSVKPVSVVVYDRDENSYPIEDFIDLHDTHGNKLRYPKEGECIINDNLAVRLGLQVGDTLMVHDGEMNVIEAKIISTCENFVNNYMYINKETYESQMHKKFLMNTAYVQGIRNEDSEIGQVGAVIDPSNDGAKLMNADNVNSVSITKEFRDRIERMMSALDYVVLLVIACAATLAFIVLYNLTNINITERIREIATIKVLGFNRGEVSQYVFRENIVLTVISALVGLPLGTLLHKFVMSQVIVDNISFDIHVTPMSYLMAFIGTLVFAVIVNFVLYFKLDKINMAESLKSVE